MPLWGRFLARNETNNSEVVISFDELFHSFSRYPVYLHFVFCIKQWSSYTQEITFNSDRVYTGLPSDKLQTDTFQEKLLTTNKKISRFGHVGIPFPIFVN